MSGKLAGEPFGEDREVVAAVECVADLKWSNLSSNMALQCAPRACSTMCTLFVL